MRGVEYDSRTLRAARIELKDSSELVVDSVYSALLSKISEPARQRR